MSQTKQPTNTNAGPSKNHRPNTHNNFKTTAFERRIIQKYRAINRTPGTLYGKAQQAWAEISLYVKDPEEWLKRRIGEQNMAFIDGTSNVILWEMVAWLIY
jgi:hypothetical protein